MERDIINKPMSVQVKLSHEMSFRKLNFQNFLDFVIANKVWSVISLVSQGNRYLLSLFTAGIDFWEGKLTVFIKIVKSPYQNDYFGFIY